MNSRDLNSSTSYSKLSNLKALYSWPSAIKGYLHFRTWIQRKKITSILVQHAFPMALDVLPGSMGWLAGRRKMIEISEVWGSGTCPPKRAEFPQI